MSKEKIILFGNRTSDKNGNTADIQVTSLIIHVNSGMGEVVYARGSYVNIAEFTVEALEQAGVINWNNLNKLIK